MGRSSTPTSRAGSAKFGRRRERAADHAGHLPGARRHRGGGAGELRVHPVAGAPDDRLVDPQAVLCRRRSLGLFARRRGAAAARPYRAQPEPAEAGVGPRRARADAAPALPVAGHGARSPHGRSARPSRSPMRSGEWFRNGAADGFNIMPPVLPTGLTDFVDQVVPILQKRGLVPHRIRGHDAAREPRARAAGQPVRRCAPTQPTAERSA